jgi:hypothetical protein
MKFISTFLTLCILFSAVSLQAGIVIKSTEKSKKMNMDMTTTMYVEKDRLRMEMSGTGENQIIIFRGDKNLFWVVNKDKKSYAEMTQDDMKKLKAKMEEMQKMMEEQMKNLPPEQRKMMEQMMPGSMAKAKVVKSEYKKKASGQKVGKWICDQYDVFKDGKKSSEMWTTSWDQIGISREDVAGLKKMGEFFEVISEDIVDFMKVGSEEWEKEHGMTGIPVKWIDYVDGQPESQGEMKEVVKKNLDGSLFELPSGFDKEDNPWEKQGAGMSPY